MVNNFPTSGEIDDRLDKRPTISLSVWFDVKDNIFFVIFGDEDTYTLRHYESSDFWLLWRHIDDVITISKNSSLFFSSF